MQYNLLIYAMKFMNFDTLISYFFIAKYLKI